MLKTNVMRILDKEKIAYEPFSYSPELTEGVKIAEVLGENPKYVFKTLVTESGAKEHFVFVIPVAETLDLKAAARGYIHGGCSPIGMKKRFKTVIDESAVELEFFYVSAGKVGFQVKLSPKEICRLTNADFAKITV